MSIQPRIMTVILGALMSALLYSPNLLCTISAVAVLASVVATCCFPGGFFGTAAVLLAGVELCLDSRPMWVVGGAGLCGLCFLLFAQAQSVGVSAKSMMGWVAARFPLLLMATSSTAIALVLSLASLPGWVVWCAPPAAAAAVILLVKPLKTTKERNETR